MQTLDARHSELFLHDEFKSGKWDFEDIGVHRVDSHCNAAAGALFEVEHLKSTSTASKSYSLTRILHHLFVIYYTLVCFKNTQMLEPAGVMDTKSWIGQTNDWQPKARIGHHAVAVNTNLQPNEGNFFMIIKSQNISNHIQYYTIYTLILVIHMQALM